MKNIVLILFIALTIAWALAACTPQQIQQSPTAVNTSEPISTTTVASSLKPSGTATFSPTVESSRTPTVSYTATPKQLPTTAAPSATQKPTPFLLADPGPLSVGKRIFGFQDPSRGGREVEISVWYPAVLPADQAGEVVEDAPADLSGAPYPVILSSAKSGGFFAAHLVSHGFVYVGIRNIDTYEQMDQNLIDQPLDILFALDQVASQPLVGLEGMFDTDRAGAMGYSFDGYNSLAISGARIDPQSYLERCRDVSTMEPPLSDFWIRFYCDLAAKWDDFEAHAGSQITVSEDGLWQPMTDARILAVMPMAPDGTWIFGERGLAPVDRPVLILVGTNDRFDGLSVYDTESVYIFEHLGTPDGILISFIGKDHYMIYNPEPVERMQHFATAFFGFHLQAREDYAEYFSQDFVDQYDDLAWGVFK
jgi:predicted dienelactone hydrolase